MHESRISLEVCERENEKEK